MSVLFYMVLFTKLILTVVLLVVDLCLRVFDRHARNNLRLRMLADWLSEMSVQSFPSS
jgi:hypothetical protein